MKSVSSKILVVVVVAVAIFALANPATATDRFVSIGKNLWSITSNVGDHVSAWLDKNTGDIAKHKK